MSLLQIDLTPPSVPIIIAPSNGSYSSTPLVISFYIGATASDNSITLTISLIGYQNGSIVAANQVSSLTLAFGPSYSSIGLHSVSIPTPQINIAPIGSDITLTSTNGISALMDGGIYSLVMSYRWLYNGNSATSMIVTNITYDITPPTIPLLYTPMSSTYYGPLTLPVNYSIGEIAKSGSVILTIINYKTNQIMATVTFDTSMETSGDHFIALPIYSLMITPGNDIVNTLRMEYVPNLLLV
jgi:hypothetical protein